MEPWPSPTKQVRLAGALFNRPLHICAFCNGRDEEYRVMLPFIKGGFDQGHRAFHVVDSRRLPKYANNTVCCTYDVSRFGAALVMDMIRTHPMVIVGGGLHENPLWVPPDEFLEELRQRTAPTSVV